MIGTSIVVLAISKQKFIKIKKHLLTKANIYPIQPNIVVISAYVIYLMKIGLLNWTFNLIVIIVIH